MDNSEKCCTTTCSSQQTELLEISMPRKYKKKFHDWNKKGHSPDIPSVLAVLLMCPFSPPPLNNQVNDFVILYVCKLNSFLRLCPQYPNFALSILYQACLHKLKLLPPLFTCFFQRRGQAFPLTSPLSSSFLGEHFHPVWGDCILLIPVWCISCETGSNEIEGPESPMLCTLHKMYFLLH